MEIVYVLSIFYIGTVLGAPTKNVTFYETIKTVCPKIDTDTNKNNVKIFSNCKNLKLTEKQPTKKDLLCLLFYNSYITCCNQTENTEIPELTFDFYKRYNLNTICDNVAILTDLPQTNQSLEILKTLINSKENCIELCKGDGIIFEIEPVCIISYYYGHLVKHEKNEIKSNQTVQKPVQLPDNTKDKLALKEEIDSTKPQSNPHNENKQDSKLNNVHKDESKPVKPDDQLPENTKLETVQENKPEPANLNQAQVTKIEPNLVDDSKPNSPPKPIVEPKTPKTTVDVKKTTEGDKLSDNKSVLETDTKPEIITEKNNEAPQGDAVDKLNIEDLQQNGGTIEQPIQTDFERKGTQEEQQLKQQDDFNSEEDDDTDVVDDLKISNKPKENNKPNTIDESQAVDYTTEMEGDSYFFSYFMMLCLIFIVGYICYHNKQKILALILEGRRGKRQYRSRRPNSANYHKLDSNLEEAITSSCNKNASNVIY